MFVFNILVQVKPSPVYQSQVKLPLISVCLHCIHQYLHILFLGTHFFHSVYSISLEELLCTGGACSGMFWRNCMRSCVHVVSCVLKGLNLCTCSELDIWGTVVAYMR